MRKVVKHSDKRLIERYGLGITEYGRKELITTIQMSEGIFVERSSLARTIWLIEYRGKWVKCVYNARRKDIVTFLPIMKSDRELINDYPESKKIDNEIRLANRILRSLGFDI